MDPEQNNNETQNTSLNIKQDILVPMLSYLDGKKSYIFAIVALTVAFAGLEGWLSQNAQSYLLAVLGVLSGSAQYSTVKLGARR